MNSSEYVFQVSDYQDKPPSYNQIMLETQKY